MLILNFFICHITTFLAIIKISLIFIKHQKFFANMAVDCLYWLIFSIIVSVLFYFTFFLLYWQSLPSILWFKLIFLLRYSIISKLFIIVRGGIFVFLAFSFFVEWYSTSASTRHSLVIELLLLKPWPDIWMVKFWLLRRTPRLIVRWGHLSFVYFFFHRHFFCIVKFVKTNLILIAEFKINFFFVCSNVWMILQFFDVNNIRERGRIRCFFEILFFFGRFYGCVSN